MNTPLKSPIHPLLPRHRVWSAVPWSVFAALAIACTAAHPCARAQDDSQTQVSDKTREQIAAIEHDRDQRTPEQRKINSQLLYAFRQSVSGTAVSGAPHLRSPLTAEPDGRYKVKLTADVSDKLLSAIGALGGKVLDSYPPYRVVYALMPLAMLEKLAQRPDVQFIGLPPKKSLRNRSHQVSSATTPQAVETAVNDPEGDATHGAKAVRTQYNVTGSGVKVGVISDSLDDSSNSYATALNKGYVSAVTVIPNQAGTGTAEGLAMLEIVHRLAPGAQLYFAGPDSEQDMANDIKAMQADGCRIIIDDLGYGDENPFQDDVISLAVVDVTEKQVDYFSAGGNSGNLDGGMTSCWEGDYVSTNKDGFLDFNSGLGKSVLEKNLVSGASVDIELFWSEPEGNVTSQYNLYDFDAAGNVVQVANDDVTQTELPYQTFDTVAAGDRLAVKLASGVARFLHLDTSGDNATFQVGTAGHARGHNALDAANAFCVAATPASTSADNTPNGPYPNEFNRTNSVEDFSDDGLRRMFFKPDGTAYTPGNFTATGGKVFARPDFTAADGVTTSVPAVGGDAPFFGTSAAAPHAGALAALALSYKPSLTAEEISRTLIFGTVQINQPGPKNRDAGTGILLAPSIFKQIPTAAPPAITSAATATGITDQAFSYQITASNSPTSYGVMGLPPGLTANAKTGLVSGTVKGEGKVSLTLNAYNAGGKGSATLTVTFTAAK